MGERDNDPDGQNVTMTKVVSREGAAPRKKAYEKPRVIHRAPLEAMAIACTPHPPGKAPLASGCTSGFS